MRLEWIEDILAVIDAGSLARAAERRFVTQSAFTRRIRMIEEHIGAELFDRNRKPIEVLPAVRSLEQELRETAARLVGLRSRLLNASGSPGSAVAFACQHAITDTISPRIVAALTRKDGLSVRVRSGNRDECLMMLLSGDVDFALMYEAPGLRSAAIPRAFESVTLDSELLVPVCTADLRDLARGPALPIVSYPADVFLGRVFSLTLAPRLPAGVTTQSRAETALTLAAYRYALNGIGIAWLPLTLVRGALDTGALLRLDETLPAGALDLVMVWLPEPKRPEIGQIRQELLNRLYPDAGSERLPDCPADAVEPIDRTEQG
ncbi:LysR family transcriptional regulator [Sulfitobacter aestuarii]|uniref:LysR family transcriptional regulator n=1 Tax=Sulfitobacter aestuarii TaxID=2161676 RepID=A0ABW5U2B9_9RHOB